MTSTLLTVHVDATVADAVAALVSVRGTPDQASRVVLVDADGVLVDDVTPLELLGRDPSERLSAAFSGACTAIAAPPSAMRVAETSTGCDMPAPYSIAGTT